MDRFGLGWRPPLALAIEQQLEHIDVLEIIADNWFARSRREWLSLRALARERPVYLHGVGLGLASAWPVATRPLRAMARLVGCVEPAGWSEHLAFVRAGGIEIGHLCAPPRTATTLAATLDNIERASRVVGSKPWLENIATLVEPPGSTMSECEWITAVIAGSGCGLLLDLHNLHANAVNFGGDAEQLLAALPLAAVRGVHLSGGCWMSWGGERRLVDDHIHDPPPEVYALLQALARLSAQPLTVLIERDGEYPDISVLLAQLLQARAVVARGRADMGAVP